MSVSDTDINVDPDWIQIIIGSKSDSDQIVLDTDNKYESRLDSDGSNCLVTDNKCGSEMFQELMVSRNV